jgi:tRNA (adenine57-N1/adenine58-N1)-methyltransferase
MLSASTIAQATQPELSPFLHPGATATESSLAILHLRRDHLLPTVLRNPTENTDYAEGHVTNTRFGSFPHSTLVGAPWGSQVLASKVDTGSRGGRGKKRKIAEVAEGEDGETSGPKAAVTAASGFAHLIPPTPETWTISLPHRTQVVYTPDYSYVLQKIRARPGSTIIEAGAGSGSFTHASARAVFNGYPSYAKVESNVVSKPRKKHQYGRVFSFEYHEPRANELQKEIKSHGLSSVVRVTHRNVYEDGFLVQATSNPDDPHLAPESNDDVSTPFQMISPNATAVFLDLPAPWLALPNLTRKSPSPLHPTEPVHICCFLPCIEQVTDCVNSLRKHGWLEINMQELIHRRIDVRRERVGLDLEGMRGVNSSPATVDEAVKRLMEIEKHAQMRGNAANNRDDDDAATPGELPESKNARMARIAAEEANRKVYKEGRLVHRTEPEIKTHTSYLVFAVLPREWTAEDEAACRAKWPPEKVAEQSQAGGKGGKSGKQGKSKDRDGGGKGVKAGRKDEK